MGVCEGAPRCVLPDHAGRADYHGASVNSAARFMDAAAHGGMVCVCVCVGGGVCCVCCVMARLACCLGTGFICLSLPTAGSTVDVI